LLEKNPAVAHIRSTDKSILPFPKLIAPWAILPMIAVLNEQSAFFLKFEN
jgi:hypothetical protein